MFKWSFLRADVSFTILGVDFLHANKLLVDVAANSLVDSSTSDRFSLTGQPSGHKASIMLPAAPGGVGPSTHPARGSQRHNQAGIIHRRRRGPSHTELHTSCPRGGPAGGTGRRPYADNYSGYSGFISGRAQPGEGATTDFMRGGHFLSTSDTPVASAFRRLDTEKLAAAKKEFLALEAAGIVRHSTSPWASPLHLVRKADGSWQPCCDYRRLNAVTVPYTYPIPNMMDFVARAAGSKVFSKIDLKKGYHQIPMNPGDIPKTAITTPFGLFEFTRMTFGMRNTGNTFQRLMDRVLAGVKCAFPYLDDIFIFGKGEAEHRNHLMLVLQRLQGAGLAANAEKCEFRKSELDFL